MALSDLDLYSGLCSWKFKTRASMSISITKEKEDKPDYLFYWFNLSSFYRVSEDEIAKLGCFVSGVVDRVTPNAVYVNGKDYSMGTIFTDHLSDHHGKYLFALILVILVSCLVLLFSLAMQGLLLWWSLGMRTSSSLLTISLSLTLACQIFICLIF